MTCSLSTDARMVVWPVSDDAAANVDCLDSIPRNFSDNASTRRVTESRGTRRDAAPGPAAVLNGLPSFCSFAQLRAYSVKPEGKLMKQRISRRQFLTTSAAAPVVLSAAGTLAAGSPKTGRNPGAGAWVAWLDGKAPEVAQGVTWGVPWPRGKQRAKEFVLRDAAGKALSLQNWPLAYWPDGTLSGRRILSHPISASATGRSKSSRNAPPPNYPRKSCSRSSPIRSKSTPAVSCAESRSAAPC